MIKPKHFYINDSAFVLTTIGFIFNIILLTYLLLSILVCHIFNGVKLVLLNDYIFACTSLLGRSFLYSIVVIFVPLLSLPENILKLKIKKEVWAKKIAIISIFEDGIDIPLALPKRVLFSELISIEYQKGYPFNKLIIEFNRDDEVQARSSFWYIRKHIHGEKIKLVWYLPIEKNFVVGLEQAVLKIQNRIV